MKSESNLDFISSNWYFHIKDQPSYKKREVLYSLGQYKFMYFLT